MQNTIKEIIELQAENNITELNEEITFTNSDGDITIDTYNEFGVEGSNQDGDEVIYDWHELSSDVLNVILNEFISIDDEHYERQCEDEALDKIMDKTKDFNY